MIFSREAKNSEKHKPVVGFEVEGVLGEGLLLLALLLPFELIIFGPDFLLLLFLT